MARHYPLQKLYEKHLGYLGVVAPLEKTVWALIKKNPPAPSLLDALTEITSFEEEVKEHSDPWHFLDRWRELLAINLLVHLQETASHYRKAVQDHVSINLSHYPFWDEFQLPAALCALNCHLSELAIPSMTPMQLKSGAVPLESSGIWSWAQVPHVRFHAELGILWCLLGKVMQHEGFISAAVRLAEWHLQTLDFHFFPFSGLFVQEEDASLCALLTNNYLLFHSIATLTNNPRMEYAAQRQMEYLDKILLAGDTRIHPLAPLLEEWIGRLGEKVPPEAFELPNKIWDPSTSIGGYRSPSYSVVSTLCGGKTGLGCFHHEDIQMINFGPQHLPISECQGFGIEEEAYLDDQCLHLEAGTAERDFHLQRDVRVTAESMSRKSIPLFRNNGFSGLWIDAEQQFHQNIFKIRTSFLGLTPSDALAFTFFVKAKHCTVNGQSVHLRSLARYQGKPYPISLHGDQATLTIECGHGEGELQIIPLAGDYSFWSADFLLAYIIDPHKPTYTWQICLLNQGEKQWLKCRMKEV